MVVYDPCERLKVIRTQLIPAILTSAKENTTSDIKTAIEDNLPVLEENCYKLLENCEKKWPECNKEIELCNRDNIKKVFNDTREKLEKIWKEKEQESSVSG
ncbi:MAG: hypothetical protein PHU34_07120 [Candidatus Methanoperedens sp.]|nr:hypothetical protein [Candidatus Methanoperedens sp.]